MSILSRIQKEIEEVYLLPPSLDVENFLIDHQTLCSLAPHQNGTSEETLLFQETPDALQMGLYIAPHLLKLLATESPWTRLTNRNLDPFCTAIEGVSHFLFLLTRLSSHHPVSQLEIELQAEIDKFLLCFLALERQREPLARRLLPLTLFDGYQLIPHLDSAARERYQVANRLAFQYCRKLQKISHPLDRCRLIREARCFREKSLQGKIQLLTKQGGQANLV